MWKKHGLRIATLLSILMFILIPLLSSSVTADVCFDTGPMESSYSTGPSASGNGVDLQADDDESGVVEFNCDYTFTNDAAIDTDHLAYMEVIKQVPGFPSKIDTAVLYLECRAGSYPGTLTIEDNYTQAELPVTWKVDLYIEVVNHTNSNDWAFWTPNQFLNFTINA